MAARRLVIVMVVLLALSTVASQLVPAPERSAERTRPEPERKPREETGESGWTGYAQLPGSLITARLAISNKPQPPVRVRPGDQLRLSVAGTLGQDIEIPAFGLTETMSPSAPARFDILIDRTGTFPVRAVESGRPVGRIVSTRCAPSPGAREGGSKARGCDPRGRPATKAAGRSARNPSAAEGPRHR